ncbi:MAG: PLP-dependent transferase [Calditrichia bacterium]|nr:PLP-dependent transferase [Calditrichia bacterium]
MSDELVRLSVGCEGYEDLRDDLNQALDKIENIYFHKINGISE